MSVDLWHMFCHLVAKNLKYPIVSFQYNPIDNNTYVSILLQRTFSSLDICVTLSYSLYCSMGDAAGRGEGGQCTFKKAELIKKTFFASCFVFFN